MKIIKEMVLEIGSLAVVFVILIGVCLWSFVGNGDSWEANANRTVSIDISDDPEGLKRVYSIQNMGPCTEGQEGDDEGLIGIMVGTEATLKTDEEHATCYVIDTEQIGVMQDGQFLSVIKKTWNEITASPDCGKPVC